jgi:hypothetical protein
VTFAAEFFGLRGRLFLDLDRMADWFLGFGEKRGSNRDQAFQKRYRRAECCKKDAGGLPVTDFIRLLCRILVKTAWRPRTVS